MSDGVNKSPREAAIELIKSIREELKDDSSTTTPQALKALGVAIREEIELHKSELAKMRSLEVGVLKKNIAKSVHGLPSPATPAPVQKTVFEVLKGEDFINLKYANDKEKRLTNGNGKDTVVPSDKKSKVIEADGSGGEMKKEAMDPAGMKAPTAPSTGGLKPTGVPSAKTGEAPKAPKPPMAPGANPTMHKEEMGTGAIEKNSPNTSPPPPAPAMSVPQTRPTRADGDPSLVASMGQHMQANHGNYSIFPVNNPGGNSIKPRKNELATAWQQRKQATRAANPRPPVAHRAFYVSNDGKFQDLGIHADRQAALGAVTGHHDQIAAGLGPKKSVFDILRRSELANTDESVFDILQKGFSGPRLGGRDDMSRMMTQQAFVHGSKQATQGTAALPHPGGLQPPAPMPTMEEHMDRANQFADFMPQGKFSAFGKGEFEAEECPYCKKSIKDCDCK